METQVRSIKTDMNRLIIMSSIFLAIAAPCILYVKGVTATVFIVLYCLGAALPAIGLFSQIFNAKGVGMQIGFCADRTGKQRMFMERYEEFIKLYEGRFSSSIFWISCIITLAWLIVFLTAGIEIMVYIVVGLTLLTEIGKYRVYKAIKDNKTAWGAAMYLNEISNFFKEKGVKE